MFFRNMKVCQTTKGYKKFSGIISLCLLNLHTLLSGQWFLSSALSSSHTVFCILFVTMGRLSLLSRNNKSQIWI